MGNPYLNRGESIIRTTDRISVNSISSDLLLTTCRLILVDSTHTRFEPIQIPFATIMSLQGGWNIIGDPVITLNVTDSGISDSTHTLDLVFSQLAGEHRKEECDGWVESLMDQIVLARQDTIRTDPSPVDQEAGIQPTIRRWVAPEMIQPHTTISVPRLVPLGESMTLMQPGSPLVTEHDAESAISSVQSEKTSDEEPVVPKEEIQSDNTLLPPERAIEEPMDVGEREAGLSDLVHSATSNITDSPAHQEGITRSHETEISSKIQSQDLSGIPEQEGTRPVLVEEKTELPETISGSPEIQTSPKQEYIGVSAVSKERQESEEPEILHEPEGMRPEISLTHETGSLAAVLPAEPKTCDTLPVREAEPPAESVPASHAPEGIAWPIIHTSEPASPATNPPREPEIVGCEEIPADTETPASPPPSPSSGSGRHTMIIVIAICMVILAIVGGALFYSLYLTGTYGKSHASEIIPTPVIPQTPMIPEVIIPKTGIWVRVECNSTFLGSVGIPGSLKMVSGSGNQLYQIQQSAGAVQASFQKQEYTGDLMTIEIYNNGKQIAHRSITAPKGTLDIIIDPKTGEPPGIPLNRI